MAKNPNELKETITQAIPINTLNKNKGISVLGFLTKQPMLLLAIGGILLTIGDVIFKYWTKNQTTLLYVFGMAFYMTGVILLVETYKSENIAIATAIFVIFNIISLTIISWVLFGEQTSAQQFAGIGLASLAIFLLR